MIYDRMDSISTYKNISRHLATAIDYLADTDVRRLTDGRHVVDGDNVFTIVSSYETKDPAEAGYEAHRKYIDIQIVLDGKETCFYTPVHGLKPSVSWNTEKDLGFFENPESGDVLLPMTPDVFAVFFPEDAHKPSCHLDGKQKVHKIVVKVAVSR